MTGAIDGVPAFRGRPRPAPTGLPPHDIAAEEAVVAAVLLDDDAVPACEPVVRVADFFREQNGWIFGAAVALWRRGEPVTIPTVAHELDRAGMLDAAGGETYLAEIAGKYFTAVGVEAHARIVARDAAYRRLIQGLGQGAQIAYEGGPDLDRALARIQAMLDGITRGTSRVLASFDQVRAADSGAPQRGITTGYASLDLVLGGYKPGQIVTIGGRTDASKTALAVGSAVNVAVRGGIPVAYIPLEDSASGIARRMVDHVAGVSHSWIRRASLTNAERRAHLDRWAAADAFLTGFGDYLMLPEDGSEPMTFEEVERYIARAAVEGARLVVVDHLHALDMHSSRERGQSDAAVVSAWMKFFNRIGIRYGLATLLVAQVSREGSARDAEDIVPPMRTLKESGAIEQLSKAVVMVGLEPMYSFGLPERGLQAYVEKVKEYEGESRWIVDHPGAPPEGQRPALYLDRRAGAVYERGTPPLLPPVSQGALAEVA